MNIKLYSFFSGAGFLDLGFEKNGYKIQFVNEYNKAFLSAYKYARMKMNLAEPEYGYFDCDINNFNNSNCNFLATVVKKDKLDGIVGFIGGPPCPDFSVAGKNEGIAGTNGQLTSTYRDIIIKHRPDFFVFENVKGLWKTKKHREAYNEIKASLLNVGYILSDTLLNALYYGVPQDRERILLIGIHESICNKDITKEYLENNHDWGISEKYANIDIKKQYWVDKTEFCENIKLPPESFKFQELTVEYWFKKNNVENHANATDYFKPRQGKSKMDTILEGDVSRKSFKRLHRWRYSPTVAYGNNEVHLHPYKSRRLSVAEALALQSLPENFIIEPTLTLSDKFKTIGNGVPFLMSLGIAKSLKHILLNCIRKQ